MEKLCLGWEEKLKEYLIKNEIGRQKTLELLKAKDPSIHHSVYVDADELENDDDNPVIFPSILLNPSKTLEKSDEIVLKACEMVYNEEKDKIKSLKMKSKVHFRLSSLPNVSELNFSNVPKSEHIGRLLAVSGTVIKSTIPNMMEHSKLFSCSKCDFKFVVGVDYAQFYRLQKPTVCPNPQGCNGSYFNPVSTCTNPELCKDIQEIKIQEQLTNLSMGAVPRSIWVTLDDDLINSCKPGDNVVVIGVVCTRWDNLGKGQDGRTNLALCIKANHVKVNNHQQISAIATEKLNRGFQNYWERHKNNPLEGRNKIIASFCPQVYGLYAIKLAMSVVLCGGVERIDSGGTKSRGESHMLMVGDPGTGKSQLLRFASKLSQRSVLTTGIGSTSAGLTVSAVRDSGNWHLESGALVLADGGICCIDEFNTIKESDRACIHEAMEQQSISVAKAGLVCSLETRCTVLASANPKGQYDPSMPLTVNTSIASPLLSRFDLVFVLLDTRNEDWDRLVSSYVLQGKNIFKELSKTGSADWNLEKLRSYFAYCRKINPMLSSDSSVILSTYFRYQRKKTDECFGRTTVRLLQSAVRLAQGHARLMCHEEVTIVDAIYAVILLEASFDSAHSLLNGTNPIHTIIPKDPIEEYKSQGSALCKKLELEDIWSREEERLSKEHNLSYLPNKFGNESEDCNKPQKESKLMAKVLNTVQNTQYIGLTQAKPQVVKAKKRPGPKPKKKNQEETSEEPLKKIPRLSQKEEENYLFDFDDSFDDFEKLDNLATSTQLKNTDKEISCISSQLSKFEDNKELLKEKPNSKKNKIFSSPKTVPLKTNVNFNNSHQDTSAAFNDNEDSDDFLDMIFTPFDEDNEPFSKSDSNEEQKLTEIVEKSKTPENNHLKPSVVNFIRSFSAEKPKPEPEKPNVFSDSSPKNFLFEEDADDIPSFDD